MHCPTIKPLDEATLLREAGVPGRLVVVDESHPRCSMASDIAGLAAERVFGSLKAPIRQVTGFHSPVPFSDTLEELYIPSAAKIIAAVQSTKEYK